MAGAQAEKPIQQGDGAPSWLAGPGSACREHFPFPAETARLNEALAPQITAGTQLRMLAGIAFDGPPTASGPSCSRIQAPLITFSPAPGLPGKSRRLDEAGEHTLNKKAFGVLWVSRDPVEIHARLLLEARHSSLQYVGRPPYRPFAKYCKDVVFQPAGRCESGRPPLIRHGSPRCIGISVGERSVAGRPNVLKRRMPCFKQ